MTRFQIFGYDGGIYGNSDLNLNCALLRAEKRAGNDQMWDKAEKIWQMF